MQDQEAGTLEEKVKVHLLPGKALQESLLQVRRKSRAPDLAGRLLGFETFLVRRLLGFETFLVRRVVEFETFLVRRVLEFLRF